MTKKVQRKTRPLTYLINMVDNFSPEEKYISALSIMKETNPDALKKIKMADFTQNVKTNAYNLRPRSACSNKDKLKTGPDNKPPIKVKAPTEREQTLTLSHPENQKGTAPPSPDTNSETNTIYTDQEIQDGYLRSTQNFTIKPNEIVKIRQNMIFEGTKCFQLQPVQYNKVKIALVENENDITKFDAIIKNISDSDVVINKKTKLFKIVGQNMLITQDELKQSDIFFPNQPYTINKTSWKNVTGEKHSYHYFNKIISIPNMENMQDIILNLTENENELKKVSNNELFHKAQVEQMFFSQIKPETLKLLQKNDDFCNKLYNEVKHTKNEEKFTIKYGILYKIIQEKLTLIIPEVMVKPIIEHLHAKYLHPSNKKLLDIFQTRYYNPNVKNIIKQIQQRCFMCAISKKTTVHQKVENKERSIYPTKPNEYISIDLINVPKNVQDIKYILLMQDVYSSYVTAYPLLTKSAPNIFNALTAHFFNFQPPEYIKMDAEPALITACSALANKFAIKLTSSTPYAHQSNYVERAYQSLKRMISTAIYQDPTTERHDFLVPLYSAITTFNDTPVNDNAFSKTEIMFNKKLDNLFPFTEDIQQIEPTINNKHYNTKKPVKPYKKYRNGQIFYISSENTKTEETSIFRMNRSGPFKVVHDYERQDTVFAKCLITEKRFYIHKSKIITPETQKNIELKLTSDWDKEFPLIQQTKYPK